MDPKTIDVAGLEQTIAQAKDLLDKAPADDKPGLEEQIARGEKALAALQQQQHTAYKTEHEELLALRREREERTIGEMARDMGRQYAQGVKQAQEEREKEIAALIQREMAQFVGSDAEGSLRSMVTKVVPDVLGEFRGGRKFQADQTPETTAAGVKGGEGARVTKENLGEPDTFLGFCRAIARKDADTIIRMQTHHGVTVGSKAHYVPYMGVGGKALVSGGGWADATAGPAGGYVVPVEYVNQMLPALYAYQVLARAGARRYPMTSPSLRQGQLTGSATASYTGEAAAITQSQQTFGLFSLTAKELAGLVPVSRQFLNDASPAADAIVRQDMAQVMGLKMDVTMLTATGSTTVPQGILTATGTTQIAPVGANGDAPTYAMIIDMITRLRKSLVPRVNPAWIMPPDLQGALLRVVDTTGRPIFAAWGQGPQDNPAMFANNNGQQGPDGYLMGIPVFTTTQLALGTTGTGATATLALAEMSQVIIGELGDMELDVSTEGTYVTGGTTVAAWQNNLALFRAIMRHDVGLARSSAVICRNGVIYT